jgi:hypothetical protein
MDIMVIKTMVKNKNNLNHYYIAREKNFDQFYTNPLTAKKLANIFAEEEKN